MLHAPKNVNLIRNNLSLLCGVLSAAVFALLPVTAQAQCANWDASGEWDLIQRGQNYPVRLTLQQTGRVLNGKAEATKVTQSFLHQDIDFITASVDGTIDGDSLSVQIYWPNGLTGVYSGKVRASGRVEGEGFEKASPNVRHIWHSQGVLKCAPLPPPKPISKTGKMPQTAAPKPISKSGKIAKSPPAPTTIKAPGIIASPVAYPVPGNPTGYFTLTWDAGPDHPYAEVWFKVNNAEDIFLVEQGKGSRQITVERGRYYTFILTDSGKTLSTVTVIAP